MTNNLLKHLWTSCCSRSISAVISQKLLELLYEEVCAHVVPIPRLHIALMSGGFTQIVYNFLVIAVYNTDCHHKVPFVSGEISF